MTPSAQVQFAKFVIAACNVVGSACGQQGVDTPEVELRDDEPLDVELFELLLTDDPLLKDDVLLVDDFEELEDDELLEHAPDRLIATSI